MFPRAREMQVIGDNLSVPNREFPLPPNCLRGIVAVVWLVKLDYV